MLVTLSVLLEMRQHVSRGEPPGNYASSLLAYICESQTTPKPDCIRYIEEKLYDCYFGFECLTEWNWNDAICGICGICLPFENGDGNCKPLEGKVIHFMYMYIALVIFH